MTKDENIGDERSRPALFCIRFRLSDLNTGTNIKQCNIICKKSILKLLQCNLFI